MPLKTIEWRDDAAVIVDQTLLPVEQLVYLRVETIEHMWEAIKRLQVRGAPAIGIAAAFGLYLGARTAPTPRPRLRFCEFFPRKSRAPCLLPAHRGQPVLGAEAHAGRCDAGRNASWATVAAVKEGLFDEARESRGDRECAADRGARLHRSLGGKKRSDPLQCGRPRHLRVRHRSRAGLCGSPKKATRSMCLQTRPGGSCRERGSPPSS